MQIYPNASEKDGLTYYFPFALSSSRNFPKTTLSGNAEAVKFDVRTTIVLFEPNQCSPTHTLALSHITKFSCNPGSPKYEKFVKID